jgi:DNA-binding transcriptional ArsR family regulator
MSSQKSSTDAIDSLSLEELRDEYPSGWRILVQNESVGYILDAVMDALPGTEFTKSELATEADVSRQSVYTHLDLLLALGVLEPVEKSSPQRYRANTESELLALLHQLNGTVNQQLAD